MALPRRSMPGVQARRGLRRLEERVRRLPRSSLEDLIADGARTSDVARPTFGVRALVTSVPGTRPEEEGDRARRRSPGLREPERVCVETEEHLRLLHQVDVEHVVEERGLTEQRQQR